MESQFEAAAKKVEDEFRKIIDRGIEKAAERQLTVAERMRDVDRLAHATAPKTGKRHDYRVIESATSELESEINTVGDYFNRITDELKEIDALLPDQDRLLAPGFPHRSHYPNLHAIMLSR